jgi:hypothetical protein
MRTARSFSSGGYRFVVGFFSMTPSSLPRYGASGIPRPIHIAHTDPLDPSGALPIAPYDSDASRWKTLAWVDRRTGLPIRVTTDALDGELRPGFVRVKTYGDTLREYLTNPEAKSLGPDSAPVRADTVGLLRRRPVTGIQPIRRIGKEANHLDERTWGLDTDASQYLTE